MTRELSKGANTPLDTGAVNVAVRWTGSVDIDIAALLCASSGKVRSDNDFVFYNQPRHPVSGVAHAGKSRGHESTDNLTINLTNVESEIQRVVVTGSADGGNFGALNTLSIEVSDAANNSQLLRFVVSDATVETAMILGEFYRRGGEWKFRAVGQGYAAGLAGLARDFGISVDDEPAPPPAVPAPRPINSHPPASAPISPPGYSRPTASPPISQPAYAYPNPTQQPIPQAAYAHPNPAPTPIPQPIDYSRQPTRNSTSAPAAQAPAPVAAPSTRRAPSPTPPAPTGRSDKAAASSRRAAAAPAAPPALQAAAEQVKPLIDEWRRIAHYVGEAAAAMLCDFAANNADLTQALRDLAAARDAVTETFHGKFGQQAPSGYGGTAFIWSDWCKAAHRVNNDLIQARPPWTEANRKQWTARWNTQVRELLSSYEPTVRALSVGAWKHMRDEGSKRSADTKQAMTYSAPPLNEPPSPAGPRTVRVDPEHPDPTGPGPLNFYLGHLAADGLSFSSSSHGDYERSADKLELPNLRVPVLLDLDATGALVVSDRRCLEGPILNLLSSLPANQMLLKIFDPEHGGNSAKFLFGLGDSADRVIGDRVKTSDRELNDLLQSTEEHITFVTQRFLQGEHKSLTEYNAAAGEVAEPYQLLMLYDFPSGFSRAGHLDKDQLDRLSKIIRNGPRTGVFTVLVCPTPDKLLACAADDQAPTLRQVPWFFTGPVTHEPTFESIARSTDIRVPTTVAGPRTPGTGAKIDNGTISWTFAPASPPNDSIATSQLDAVKRNMHSASDVQVTPQRIAQLADQAQQSESAVLGQRVSPTVAHPDQPETWWRASSQRGVVAHFGRIGARQVADLRVDSEVNTYSALIGGRPGSGKSVLIHAIIMSIATEYAPTEVELYLIDFKEGVEFKQYADIGLPHARVIAIESERDFGLSVLQRAAGEIKRRGELFRGEGQGAANLEQYRARTQRPLKRLVLIIDEFQQLFYRDDKIAAQSAEILELILRQGRAFGIHLLLASQSLAGMASLGKHVLGLIPTRIALQSNDSDSRMILGDENADAQSLVRAGEGILNRKGGHKDANERFQAAFWSSEDRAEVLQSVVARTNREGIQYNTTVFDGHKSADIRSVDIGALIPTIEPGFKGIAIPVGLPLTLDPLPYFARLPRDAGSNVLVVDEHAEGTLAVAVSSLSSQGVAVDILDFAGEDGDWPAIRLALEGLPGVAVHGRRSMRTALSELTATLAERHSKNDHSGTPHVLLIVAMGRGRDFDANDSYNEESPSHQLGEILRDGPEVGVFTIAWFDRAASIRKRLDNQQLNEFGQRLITSMSAQDSSMLIDSDSAGGLKSGQGILADVDRAVEYKIRTFSVPPTEWLARFEIGTGAR